MMSPHAALASDIFRIYLAVALGLLAAAGLVLTLAKWVMRKDVSAAAAAYRGWLIMVPIVVGCLFLGRTATIALFTALAALAFHEFARATGLYRQRAIAGVVYCGILAVGALSLVGDPNQNVPGWYGLFMALPVYVVAAILVVPILFDRTSGQVQAMALGVVGFIYIGWMFGHLAFLANSADAYGYLLYLLFAVEVNDVAAFTFGKLFGRHPLRDNISPNKTWEGSLGAVAISLVLPFALWFSFPHFSVVDCMVTGLIVGIGGQLGDLSISVIKRDLDIKDMGTVIPGHGGVLDRIDSLIFVAPLFFHVTRYFHGLY